MILLKKMIHTETDYAALILRIFLGCIFFPHGAQKVLGWFGGYGFDATLKHFTQTMHIPLPFALLAIAAEFFGALGLIVGCFTRVAALGIASVMTVAILTVHLHNGFFMNWMGTQKGEGFEYHLLAIAIALALMVKGGGAWSIDRKLS